MDETNEEILFSEAINALETALYCSDNDSMFTGDIDIEDLTEWLSDDEELNDNEDERYHSHAFHQKQCEFNATSSNLFNVNPSPGFNQDAYLNALQNLELLMMKTDQSRRQVLRHNVNDSSPKNMFIPVNRCMDGSNYYQMASDTSMLDYSKMVQEGNSRKFASVSSIEDEMRYPCDVDTFKCKTRDVASFSLPRRSSDLNPQVMVRLHGLMSGKHNSLTIELEKSRRQINVMRKCAQNNLAKMA